MICSWIFTPEWRHIRRHALAAVITWRSLDHVHGRLDAVKTDALTGCNRRQQWRHRLRRVIRSQRRSTFAALFHGCGFVMTDRRPSLMCPLHGGRSDHLLGHSLWRTGQVGGRRPPTEISSAGRFVRQTVTFGTTRSRPIIRGIVSDYVACVRPGDCGISRRGRPNNEHTHYVMNDIRLIQRWHRDRTDAEPTWLCECG